MFRQYCSVVRKITEGWNIFKARSKNEVRGTRSFLNFLVEQGLIDEHVSNEIKKYIKFRDSEQLNADIYTLNELITFLKKYKNKDTRLYYLLRLALESGLRRSELPLAVQKLQRKEFQSEGGVVWIALNKTTKTKRAFYCFCSSETASYFVKSRRHITIRILENYSKRNSSLKWHKLRKTQATLLVQLQISSEIIDFIQGRTARSVLARHYLNLFVLAKDAMKRYLQFLDENIYSKL